jgi:hypothetical protein
MTDLVKKLTADLGWRLSSAGGKYRPKDKEVASWAPMRIPGAVPLLLWPIVSVAAILALDASGSNGLSEALTPIILVGTPVLLYWIRALLGREFILRAYRQLLEKNERFTLVEYSKYLKRQIERARTDPALGNEQEVRRLTELLARLNEKLKQGIGQDGLPTTSALAEEAMLAEGLVQTYEERSRNPLDELDARLSPELRQRVSELEREAHPAPRDRQSQ